MSVQSVRGTRDLLPQEAALFRHIITTSQSVAARYGFQEIVLPILEYSDVFEHGVGETSDIVQKEMFTLFDRNEKRLALRPEGTASVMRMMMTEKLIHQGSYRYFYAGPMFRYERPQKGRQREFNQVGFECLGEASPLADADVIAMLYEIGKELGIAQHLTLELNTLGTLETRLRYREALVTYFSQYQDRLSQDSVNRLTRNPLRILDSKSPEDIEISKGAPSLDDFLDPISREWFDKVQNALKLLEIPFVLNPRMVRGLDYYGHTTFEFTTTSLGAQGTVFAGGRYDGLSQTMGDSKPWPCVGAAGGVERLMLLCTQVPVTTPLLAVIGLGEVAQEAAYKMAHQLRQEGWRVECPLTGNAGARFKKADKEGATLCVVLGEDELKNHSVTLKDLKSGEQISCAQSQMISKIRELLTNIE